MSLAHSFNLRCSREEWLPGVILTVHRPAARSRVRNDVPPGHKGVDSTTPTLHSRGQHMPKAEEGQEETRRTERKEEASNPSRLELPASPGSH